MKGVRTMSTLEQELIEKVVRIIEAGAEPFDLVENDARAIIALIRADGARRLRELSYDTEWIEDIASIRPSQLRDLANTWEKNEH
jgi:hypothetical protein